MHSPNRLHSLVTHVIVHIHTFGSFTGRASFPFSSFTCCCAIPAYSMADMSTSQVGGCLLPWPSLHFTSPACTVSSSFKGWALKHASIVDVSRPTPSRTALALRAAFLLTYPLKSMRWSGQSAERARSFMPVDVQRVGMCTCTHQSPPGTMHRLPLWTQEDVGKAGEAAALAGALEVSP